jgi:hypothetical protein
MNLSSKVVFAAEFTMTSTYFFFDLLGHISLDAHVGLSGITHYCTGISFLDMKPW